MQPDSYLKYLVNQNGKSYYVWWSISNLPFQDAKREILIETLILQMSYVGKDSLIRIISFILRVITMLKTCEILFSCGYHEEGFCLIRPKFSRRSKRLFLFY